MSNRLPIRVAMLLNIAALTYPERAVADAVNDEVGAAPIVVNGQRDGYRSGEVDATKTGTGLRDTPQSISALSRDQLDDQAAIQLNDALRYVPGVTLGQGEGHRDQVVLRGQSSTADFFLDGLRDDAQYYRPLYNTERVEVMKGANALLFGRGGGGGIINRVSKVPRFTRTATSLAGGIDSFGGWSVSGDTTVPLGASASFRLNAALEGLANHRTTRNGQFIGIAPTLAAKLGHASTLTIAYEFDRDRRITDRGVPSMNGLPIAGYDKTFFGRPDLNRSQVDAHITRVRLDHELSPELKFALSGLFASYDKYYGNILPTGATAGTVTLAGYDSKFGRKNLIGQANLIWKGATGPVGHTLLAGVEIGDQSTAANRRDALFGASLSASVPLSATLVLPPISWTPVNRSTNSSVRSASVYAQDQIALAPWLQVIAGVRFDDFRIATLNRVNGFAAQRRDHKWSPRIAVILKPQEEVSIYASYARSFLPQSGDQFTVLDGTTLTLAPEEFRNLEAGIKWDFNSALSFSAALFQVDRFNSRSSDPLTGNPVLTGASRARGFEATLIGRLTAAWQISLGFAHQEGEIRSATTAAPVGHRLDKLPQQQVTAWSRYNVTKKFGFGLGLVHQSSQFATIGNAVSLPGFTRIDAAAFYELTDRIALQLNVENLTDTHYYASAHTDNNIAPGAPINARFTSRVKF